MDMDAIQPGLEVWVKIGGKKVAGKVLEWAFSSEGDYLQCKVELIRENPLDPANPIRGIHPKPIQSYKLTYRGERPKRERRNRKKETEDGLASIREALARLDLTAGDPCNKHPDTCDCDDCGYENHTAHVTISYPDLAKKDLTARQP